MKTSLKGSARKLFAGDGNWFRFDSYEIVSSGGDDLLYIRPSKGAQIIAYRPFDNAAKLLRDYIDLGRTCSKSVPFEAGSDAELKTWRHQKSQQEARHVLAFAEKYGLPGTLWECDIEIDHNARNHSRIFVANTFWSSVLDTPDNLGLLKSDAFLEHFLLRNFSIFDVLTFNKSLLKAYAEPVRSVVIDAADIFTIASDWNRFRASGESPDEMFKARDGSEIEKVSWMEWLAPRIAVSYIGLSVLMEGKHVRLDYKFKSLIDAIRIMLALDAIEHQRLRFCALKDCGEAFVAKNQRTRHCSENCSNRDRQQKWQRKQNELLKGATHGSKRPTAKKGR